MDFSDRFAGTLLALLLSPIGDDLDAADRTRKQVTPGGGRRRWLCGRGLCPEGTI